MRLRLTLCALALALPTAGYAGGGTVTQTCSALAASPVTIPLGTGFTVTGLVVGEVLSWTQATGTAEAAPARSTATYTQSGTAANGSLTITGAGNLSMVISGAGSTRFTCAAPSTGTGSDGNVTGQVSGSNQTNAISTGSTNNAQSRFDAGTGAEVSRNSLHVSTQAFGVEQQEWNAWASVEYREYSSALTGDSLDFVAGVDKLVSEDTLVGVLVGYGRLDLSDGTNTSEQKSLAIGPYFARRSEGMIIDGFLTFAKPEYETTAGNFTSIRWSLGLSASGDALASAPYLSPYLDLRAFQEDQPAYGAVAANTITSYTVSLGAQITALQPLGNSGLTPHMRVGVDSNSTRSTLAATDSFTYGRLGLGLSGQMGAGFLTIDVDYGKTRSDVFDRGVEMRWEMSF